MSITNDGVCDSRPPAPTVGARHDARGKAGGSRPGLGRAVQWDSARKRVRWARLVQVRKRGDGGC